MFLALCGGVCAVSSLSLAFCSEEGSAGACDSWTRRRREEVGETEKVGTLEEGVKKGSKGGEGKETRESGFDTVEGTVKGRRQGATVPMDGQEGGSLRFSVGCTMEGMREGDCGGGGGGVWIVRYAKKGEGRGVWLPASFSVFGDTSGGGKTTGSAKASCAGGGGGVWFRSMGSGMGGVGCLRS